MVVGGLRDDVLDPGLLTVVDLLTVGLVVAGLEVTGRAELGLDVGLAEGFLVVVPCFLIGFLVVVPTVVVLLLYTTSFKPAKGSCNPWIILLTNDSTLVFSTSSSMNAGVVISSSSRPGLDIFKLGLRTGGKFIS